LRPQKVELAYQVPSRRFGVCPTVGEHGDQRVLDGHLAGRLGDLRTEQIGDVEYVDDALAEGRDMGSNAASSPQV